MLFSVMGKQYNKLAQVLLVMNEPKIYANDYQGHAGARVSLDAIPSS